MLITQSLRRKKEEGNLFAIPRVNWQFLFFTPQEILASMREGQGVIR